VQDNATLTNLTVFGFGLGALPLGIWLIIAFFLGVILALLATAVPLARAQRKSKRLEKQLNRLKSSASA
jgi:uncharacterized integral membrane protein